MIGLLGAVVVGMLVFALPGAASGQQDGDGSRESALSALTALGGLLPPTATGECWPQAQWEARQTLQIHTELMVASLTCPQAYRGGDLYQQYRQFTVTHADSIRRAQQRLETAVGGQQAFDLYRTDLANAEAQLVAELSIGTYCAMRESRFRSLIDTSPASFEGYVQELAARHRLRQGNC